MHPNTLKFYKYIPVKKPIYQGKFCSVPFNAIQIDNDGDVQLCDCQLHMPYTIGNIFENSLQDIWLNSKAEMVRQSVATGDFTYCNWDCSLLSRLMPAPNTIPVTETFPREIKIDLDLSCNLKCPSCRENVIIEKNSIKIQKQIQIFEEIKQWALLNQNVPVKITPLSSGEIFASHSGLKFLESLRDYPYQNLKLHITTNGTLIEKNKELIGNISHLIKSWAISIDAATAKTYQQVRGGDWEMLHRGLEYVSSLTTPVQFNFVVQKANWHEIADFAELTKKYNASVHYTNLLNWGHWTTQWWHDNNVLDRTKEHYTAVLASLQQVDHDNPGLAKFSAAISDNLKKIGNN